MAAAIVVTVLTAGAASPLLIMAAGGATGALTAGATAAIVTTANEGRMNTDKINESYGPGALWGLVGSTGGLAFSSIVSNIRYNPVTKVTQTQNIDSGVYGSGSGGGSKVFDLKNPDSFKGSSIKEVESYLDDMLSGYTKRPLKKGEGIRYFDGKGNSWQLNYGYENATDAVHGGPYLKTTTNEGIIRIPLK